MVDPKLHLHSGRTGSAITVSVIVGAPKTEIVNILDDGTLEIALAVPKFGKKADDTLIHYLAHKLGVKPEKVEIIAGIKGRDKLITILDIDTETVQSRLIRHAK